MIYSWLAGEIVSCRRWSARSQSLMQTKASTISLCNAFRRSSSILPVVLKACSDETVEIGIENISIANRVRIGQVNAHALHHWTKSNDSAALPTTKPSLRYAISSLKLLPPLPLVDEDPLPLIASVWVVFFFFFNPKTFKNECGFLSCCYGSCTLEFVLLNLISYFTIIYFFLYYWILVRTIDA